MSKVTLLRRLSQVVVVGLLAFFGLRHQLIGGGPEGSAPIDSYCPFGGVETMIYYLKTGQFLDKTNVSNFVLLGAVIVVGLLAGAAFCGWLCPFGAVQEWLAKAGKKVMERNLKIPVKLHASLTNLRFVTLFLIVYLTIRGSRLVFEEYDPFKALFHFNFETTLAIVITAATIIISILYDRFWCHYLCPLGAMFSILGRINLVGVRRNADRCENCGICADKCLAGIEVDKEIKISAGSCIKCLECINSCPSPDTMTLTIGGGAR